MNYSFQRLENLKCTIDYWTNLSIIFETVGLHQHELLMHKSSNFSILVDRSYLPECGLGITNENKSWGYSLELTSKI